jgi:hypothetical protein
MPYTGWSPAGIDDPGFDDRCAMIRLLLYFLVEEIYDAALKLSIAQHQIHVCIGR